MNVLTKIFDRMAIVGLFFRFLWRRKLYWLIPFMVIVFGFAILLIFAQSTGLGPLIYPFI